MQAVSRQCVRGAFRRSMSATTVASTSGSNPSFPEPSNTPTHFKITLRRSALRLGDAKQDTLVNLGLHKREQTVYHRHSSSIAGMILAVKELVEVENVTENQVETRWEIRQKRKPNRGFERVATKMPFGSQEAKLGLEHSRRRPQKKTDSPFVFPDEIPKPMGKIRARVLEITAKLVKNEPDTSIIEAKRLAERAARGQVPYPEEMIGDLEVTAEEIAAIAKEFDALSLARKQAQDADLVTLSTPPPPSRSGIVSDMHEIEEEDDAVSAVEASEATESEAEREARILSEGLARAAKHRVDAIAAIKRSRQ